MKPFTTFVIESEDDQIIDILFETEWVYDKSTSMLKEDTASLAQPWKLVDLDSPNIDSEVIEVYHDALEKAHMTRVHFENVLNSVAQGNKVIVRTKPLKSFMDKILNRGKKSNEIHDVLRSAILCRDATQVGKVVERIQRTFKVVEYDFKEEKGDAEFGYFGSHHFKVAVKPPGESFELIAEIQVMTERLWTYKKVAHKIYAQFRSSGEAEAEERKFGASLSKLLFKVGNH